MKILPLFACVLAVLFTACKPDMRDKWGRNGPFQQWCSAVFQADSGFINEPQGYQLQALVEEIDTAIFLVEHSNWDLPLQGPTVSFSPLERITGKYYRDVKADGVIRWILCLNALTEVGEHPYILEIGQNEKDFSLVSWALYYHGMYDCCWHGPMRGFFRLGPYFFIKTCNTGSLFCAGKAHPLYFPQRNKEETEPLAIPVSFWQRQGGRFGQSVESTWQLASDTLIVQYEYNLDTFEDQEGPPCDDCLPHDRFTAFYKIDTVLQTVKLLNREAIMQHEEASSMFDEFN